MIMTIKAFSSRHNKTILDSDHPFIKEQYYDEDSYVFTGGFDLCFGSDSNDPDDMDDIEDNGIHTNCEKGEKIATVLCTFFDEDRILNEGQDIVYVSDMIDSDTCGAISTLVKSKLHKQEIDENKIFLSLFTCYIDRFYIYPKFRQRGIARYILENMEDILLYLFNTHIHSYVTCLKPQQPNKEGNWVDSHDENGDMLKRMIRVFKAAGYKRLGKSEFFACNCAATPARSRH